MKFWEPETRTLAQLLREADKRGIKQSFGPTFDEESGAMCAFAAAYSVATGADRPFFNSVELWAVHHFRAGFIDKVVAWNDKEKKSFVEIAQALEEQA
jgi:hypothetical protein